MTLLVLARYACFVMIMRAEPAAPEPPPAWRLYNGRHLHVGFRPSFANEGAAFTFQITWANSL